MHSNSNCGFTVAIRQRDCTGTMQLASCLTRVKLPAIRERGGL
jgi:hypothetical protein